MSKRSRKFFACAGMILVLAMVLFWLTTLPHANGPLATADLGDGRILQVEGVSFGLNHRIGNSRSVLIQRLRPWLPDGLVKWVEPKYPESEINMGRPVLVVWVNAIDKATGTNV